MLLQIADMTLSDSSSLNTVLTLGAQTEATQTGPFHGTDDVLKQEVTSLEYVVTSLEYVVTSLEYVVTSLESVVT